jgi:hypothetical protein
MIGVIKERFGFIALTYDTIAKKVNRLPQAEGGSRFHKQHRNCILGFFAKVFQTARRSKADAFILVGQRMNQRGNCFGVLLRVSYPNPVRFHCN